MASFVTTDSQGNFVLDGQPWFLHGAVYFGRRPGTCGADWMGDNFDYNLSFLDRDLEAMQSIGINTLGLFIPSYAFVKNLRPVESRLEQLNFFLDKIGQAGLRAVVFDLWSVTKEEWCASREMDPGDELWNPAIHPEAEQAAIYSKQMWRPYFAGCSQIIGWVTDAGRFFDYKFTVPPVRKTWGAWLRRRFDWDFSRLQEAFLLSSEERNWDLVRMPTEMDPYFSRENPRSYEFALMQQVLVTKGANRLIKSVRSLTPNHLQLTAMEGCCFSSGNLTCHVPEDLEADALWVEYYHWEGMRSYHFVSENDRQWMPEPVADKPSVEILNAAGYVQMLTQWMKRSGKAVIICHGVDIGDQRRGVRSEDDQCKLLDRYNTMYLESGGHGISYWCWNDDELSKTFTRQFGVEYGSDTDEREKTYPQAGETMGLVRFDGSLRPVTEKVREVSERMSGKPVRESPTDVLVLLPEPVFQSLYRYRANQSAFGVFTSLARQGITAHLRMTSAGEKLIGLEDLLPYRLVILGVSTYLRDHLESPDVLLQYVEAGGTLFLPIATHDTLLDPYGKERISPALKVLSGADRVERLACHDIHSIQSLHPSFNKGLPASWQLEIGETVLFAQVSSKPGAEVLIRAGNSPLLYRHPIGKGMVYVFTWNLDVLIFKGNQIDHYDPAWDVLWKGMIQEMGLYHEMENPMRSAILEMMKS